MAKALIDSLASDFDADQYRDEYREELLALIERKAKGESIVAAPTEAPTADQGAGPDGGARGEPRGGQATRRTKSPTASRKPSRARSRPARPRADREARPKPPSRGRRARARAHEPRQGPLARGRVHQGRRRSTTTPRSPPILLPHLEGRALTRVRFPDGVEGQRFFEKRAPKHTPDWVRTAPIEMGTAGVLDFIVCDDRPTLIWLAQLAGDRAAPVALAREEAGAARPCSRSTSTRARRRPPSSARRSPCGCASCSPGSASSASRSTRARRGSRSTCRSTPRSPTSGRRPTRARSPRRSSSPSPTSSSPSRTKELRKGKVLVDWSQNDYSKTTVAVYSLRCRERPRASTPLDLGRGRRARRRRRSRVGALRGRRGPRAGRRARRPVRAGAGAQAEAAEGSEVAQSSGWRRTGLRDAAASSRRRTGVV